MMINVLNFDWSSLVNLLNWSLGAAGLLLLLGLDAWMSKTEKTHWILGDSLVLGALTLQVLGYFYLPIKDPISCPDGFAVCYLDENIRKVNSNNQLLNLGGRIVICVLFGNFLCDVARSRHRNVWSDMLALFISASGVLIHLFFDLGKRWLWFEIDYGRYTWANYYYFYVDDWMTVSNIIVSVSIVLLVLFLGCAALAGKSIQEFVAHRIQLLLFRTEYQDPKFVVPWEAVEEHALRTWITVRTHQPQCVIARSVLSSSIGFLVTVCIAVSSLASVKHRYIVMNDGFDSLRVTALALQWIFILSGWAIVCWRWLTAVVYNPRLMGTMGRLSLREYFRVEDFWKTAILEMQEDFKELDEESIYRFRYMKKFLIMFAKKLRLYKLLPILLYLQIFLVLLSKICWLISEMLFSNRYMRRLLMGGDCHVQFSVAYNLHNSREVTGPGNAGDFVKYSDVMMHMPEENPAGVWIANWKSIKDMKARLREGENEGKNCKALISLLEKTGTRKFSFAEPFTESVRRKEENFKSSSKMMVVSLLTIVIELSAFYEGSGGSLAGHSTDTVNDCRQACCEAWKIIDLVENSNTGANTGAVLVNKQADKLFRGLKESRKWLGLDLPINKDQDRTVDAAKSALEGLAEEGKKTANAGDESKDLKAVIAGNSLSMLCERMKDNSVNVQELPELLDRIQSSLADVISSCMFKMGEIIVTECRSWAEAFMEEKLWDAFYEAGRANGVTQQLRERQPEKFSDAFFEAGRANKVTQQDAFFEAGRANKVTQQDAFFEAERAKKVTQQLPIRRQHSI